MGPSDVRGTTVFHEDSTSGDMESDHRELFLYNFFIDFFLIYITNSGGWSFLSFWKVKINMECVDFKSMCVFLRPSSCYDRITSNTLTTGLMRSYVCTLNNKYVYKTRNIISCFLFLVTDRVFSDESRT